MPCLIAGISINLMLGVLYGWSVFLSPLEELLQVSRTSLSLVPSLGLVCFTVGVGVHDFLVKRLRLSLLASSVAGAAGLGHILFWLFPTYIGLLLGYGFIFGSAAGVGYGLALALARESPTQARGWAVGLTVAAFAASGMIVSSLGTVLNSLISVPRLFCYIGLLYCFCAIALVFLLRESKLSFAKQPQPEASRSTVQSGSFLHLAVGFFALCYLGIMFVSHGVAIGRDLKISVPDASLAPLILNSGYIVGGLLGGVVAARIPYRVTPVAFLFASTLSTLMMLTAPSFIFWVMLVFVIGVGFGSTVSVFVIVLTKRYGANRAGSLFGRLNVGYGLAGFAAPLTTGWFYDISGSYVISLWLGCSLGAFGMLSIATAKGRLFDRRENNS